MRNINKILETPKGSDHLEDGSVDGRIIESQRNRMGGWVLDLSGSAQGAVLGSCEHSNKPSGSI
jgi:hypothetical protein